MRSNSYRKDDKTVQICNRLHMSTVCIHVCCGGLCIISPAGSPDVRSLWADNIQTTFFPFLFRSDFYSRSFFFFFGKARLKIKVLKNYHFRYFSEPYYSGGAVPRSCFKAQTLLQRLCWHCSHIFPPQRGREPSVLWRP